MNSLVYVRTAVAISVPLSLTVSAALVWAQGSNRVLFPENYKSGVRYATVERGNIREEIYVNRVAIDAAKANEPLPSGTVITMEDYRDGSIFRYVVMEKRTGWGERYSQDVRNGDWEFQSFQPDRSVNESENVMRCMGCHRGQGSNDFVFTLDQLRSASEGVTKFPVSRTSAHLSNDESIVLSAIPAPVSD